MRRGGLRTLRSSEDPQPEEGQAQSVGAPPVAKHPFRLLPEHALGGFKGSATKGQFGKCGVPVVFQITTPNKEGKDVQQGFGIPKIVFSQIDPLPWTLNFPSHAPARPPGVWGRWTANRGPRSACGAPASPRSGPARTARRARRPPRGAGRQAPAQLRCATPQQGTT